LWNFLIFLPWPTARKGFYLCIQKRIQSSMKLKVQLNHSCSVGVGVTQFKSKYNFTFEENKMFVLNCEIIVLYRIQKYVFLFPTFSASYSSSWFQCTSIYICVTIMVSLSWVRVSVSFFIFSKKKFLKFW
jgi:hypothetical protein